MSLALRQQIGSAAVARIGDQCTRLLARICLNPLQHRQHIHRIISLDADPDHHDHLVDAIDGL